MGRRPQYGTLVTFPGQSSLSVICPYNRYISYNDGVVKYTQFTSNSSQLSVVSDFIQSETGRNFNGTRMMIAEWDEVALSPHFVSCTIQQISAHCSYMYCYTHLINNWQESMYYFYSHRPQQTHSKAS